MATPTATAVSGKGNRSLSFHTQKPVGEERRYYLTICDHASEKSSLIELEVQEVQHLAQVLGASVGRFDWPVIE